MRFQVPQFIDTETKIVGPFTLKQFLFVAAGAAVVFLLRYVFTSIFLWILCSLPIAGIAMALAFYKIDGIPLPKYILSAVSFATGVKKFTYKKEEEPIDNIEQYLKNKNGSKNQ